MRICGSVQSVAVLLVKKVKQTVDGGTVHGMKSRDTAFAGTIFGMI
jgi:hypothetical protein